MVSDFPDLVKQWHPTENSRLNPETTPAGSNKKVWWQCDEGPDHIIYIVLTNLEK